MKLIENPPDPFTLQTCEYFEGMAPPARLEIYEDATRRILAKNDSPDVGFTWSLNPYRGCQHACAYCYARPSHEYLGFGAGTDFETKIVVKKNAPELLREEFMRPSWKGETIAFSGDTDCYQPLEYHYGLTRRCLEVCLEFGNPVGVITKSFLITRDIDLLRRIHERTHLSVLLSITFAEEGAARSLEPMAASITKRLEAVRILSGAGLDVGVNIAPVIPGLNDSEIPEILKRARQAGARRASMTLLRLPGHVRDVFLSALQTHFPLAYDKILARIREVRGGRLNNAEFGARMHGEGPYWENVEQVFNLWSERLGLHRGFPVEPRPPFRRPSQQLEMGLGSSFGGIGR